MKKRLLTLCTSLILITPSLYAYDKTVNSDRLHELRSNNRLTLTPSANANYIRQLEASANYIRRLEAYTNSQRQLEAYANNQRLLLLRSTKAIKKGKAFRMHLRRSNPKIYTYSEKYKPH